MKPMLPPLTDCDPGDETDVCDEKPRPCSEACACTTIDWLEGREEASC